MKHGPFLSWFLLVGLTAPCPRAYAQEENPLPARAPADTIDGPPLVTARAWAIADGKTGKILWGTQESAALTMASTTKIMTAWIVLELAKADRKVLDEVAVVSERAAKVGGSSARLQTGDRLPVRDLLYGLLLPSGNDASVALAEHFGSRFAAEEKEEDSLVLFVAEMNRRAQSLKLAQTRYFDPHGNSKNQSSAQDLATLAWTALQNPLFAEHVQTRRHRCAIVDAEGKSRSATWENTNRLLGIEGFDGVKTGTTGAAGFCLVASGRRGSDHLLVVVLGASSNDSRYIDARNLFRWAWLERASRPVPAGK